MEIFFFFLTSRFSVHEKKERGNNLFFLSLDELLLMSNYLTTIDGALVSNSAAAVQNKEELDWELGEEVRGRRASRGQQSHRVRADGSTALTCALSTWHHRHELIHRSFFFCSSSSNSSSIWLHVAGICVRRPFKATKCRQFKVLWVVTGNSILFIYTILNKPFCLLFLKKFFSFKSLSWSLSYPPAVQTNSSRCQS